MITIQTPEQRLAQFQTWQATDPKIKQQIINLYQAEKPLMDVLKNI